METAIQKSDNGQTALVIAPAQMDLIKKTIAKDATTEELQLFIYDCGRRGVHPLDKLIHFTKRAGKYTPITSIDFLRMKAESTGNYAGNDDPVFEYDEHSHVAKATVTLWKIVNGQRCAFTASAKWSAYYPGDQQGFMWKKMPELMLGKCAEALALRKAFPGVLAGLYTTEEMDQAGPVQTAEPEKAKQPETVINVDPKDVKKGQPDEVFPDRGHLKFEDEILPIGKNKGKMFKNIPGDVLLKAVKWMEENAADRYAEVIKKAKAYLEDSGLPF